MKTIKTPTVETLANQKNWTGFSALELVQLGRTTPVAVTEQLIINAQKAAMENVEMIPLNEINRVATAWEKLECDLLDYLLEHSEA